MAGDAKDKDISWYSPNGEKLTPNQQRISVVWNDDSSSTLTIYNADIDDAGIYKCVVTSEDGSESEATVNVKIFRKSLLHLLCLSSSWPGRHLGSRQRDGHRGPADGLTGLLSSFLHPKSFYIELRAPICSYMILGQLRTHSPGPCRSKQLASIL